MRERKRWKKHSIVWMVVAGMLLIGCAPEAARQSPIKPLAIKSAATSSRVVSSETPSEAKKEDGETAIVKMMIPSNQQALGELMTRLAKKQNINLQLRLAANEPQYTLELMEALAGEEPPELYWLAGEFGGSALQAAEQAPINMMKGQDIQLTTLAQMTPPQLRVLSHSAVYGLPLGLFAEGTLVNIEVLAALLGSKDIATLKRDLMECSYNEWKVMQQAVAEYLKKPSRYQFSLGSGVYTMPNYRPAQAERLRGIWAMATVGEAAYAQNGLSSVFAAAYADPADYLNSSPDETNLFLQDPLQALYAEIEFETQHMTAESGPLARGESMVTAGQQTVDQAKGLFASGAALLWKGDTRQAIALEAEASQLEGRLFLVPTKLPFENQEVALLNNLYSVGVDGYLCLSTAHPAASRLLVQLYTDPLWIEALQNDLQLLPYTSLFPTTPVLAGLEEAVGLGEYYLHPLQQETLAATQRRMGEWINLNMMNKAEWADEDKEAFLTAVQGMLGELTAEEEN